MSNYTGDAEAIHETPTRDAGEKKVVEEYNFSSISR